MSNETFKQKYARGSSQKPTLEECYNSLDCKRHFLKSIQKYSKFFSEEEIYDLNIDAYCHTIKNFNGKSCFLTFLYRISGQLAIKKIRKKISRSKVKLGKNMELVQDTPKTTYALDLTPEEKEFLELRYVKRFKTEELKQFYGCNQYAIYEKVAKLKAKLKEVV